MTISDTDSDDKDANINDNTGTLDKEFEILELITVDRILSQSETTFVTGSTRRRDYFLM